MDDKKETIPLEKDSKVKEAKGINFFSLFGMISLILIVAVIIFSAGFYLGMHTGVNILPGILLNSVNKANVSEKQVIVSPTVFVSSSPTASLVTTKPAQGVVKKTGQLSYKVNNMTYTIETPEKWILSQKKEDFTNAVYVENGDVALIIRTNEATEGVPCGFPDAPLKASEMFPDISEFMYSTYTEFKGTGGQTYRRVDNTANPSAGKSFFAVCQKNGTSWMQPTGLGFVMYEIPYLENPEKEAAQTLEILDTIFASIKVKE